MIHSAHTGYEAVIVVGTSADVRVHIRPRIIQIQRKDARIRPIIPVAADNRDACMYVGYPFCLKRSASTRIHPPIMRPSSSTMRLIVVQRCSSNFSASSALRPSLNLKYPNS